jgi:putative endonuclease
MPFVYILRCGDGSLYTGSAKDLARRIVAHQAGKASRYTRSRLPVALAWSCRVRDWPRALRLEIRIKRLDRLEKLALVSGARRPPRLPRP